MEVTESSEMEKKILSEMYESNERLVITVSEMKSKPFFILSWEKEHWKINVEA